MRKPVSTCQTRRLVNGQAFKSPNMPTLHVQAESTDRLQDIADLLWKARKVVVITGAGISTNSGIPVGDSRLSCLGLDHILLI